MSSTCILSPAAASVSVQTTTINNKSCGLSSNSTNSPPVIHPALRPSTMQQQQSQYNNHSSSEMEDSYQSTNELLHDTVTLLSGNKGPTRVILSVFRTTADHFALIYPDNRRKASAIKPVGCINLRGVSCEETTLGAGLRGFTLRPKKCDTSSAALTFLCSDVSLLPKWIEALSSPEDHAEPKYQKTASFTTGSYDDDQQQSPPSPRRRSSPRLSSLSSLDEEDEEYDE